VSLLVNQLQRLRLGVLDDRRVRLRSYLRARLDREPPLEDPGDPPGFSLVADSDDPALPLDAPDQALLRLCQHLQRDLLASLTR
tara:strand:+ start:172 stop:423 length:252 start_codon:yes stop_codon:yes gene_type:complete